MIFLEQMILVVIVFEGISIGLVGIRFHHVDDLFGLGHIQLLVQGVESSASLSPVFGDSLGRLGLIRLSVLSINGLFDNQSPLFLFEIKFKYGKFKLNKLRKIQINTLNKCGSTVISKKLRNLKMGK